MENTPSLKIVPYSPSRSHHKKCIKSTPTRKRDGTNPVTKIRNACVSCRNKKTRCSGHLPCIRCRQRGQECQYMPTATPQGPSTSQQESVSPEVFRTGSFSEISQQSPEEYETTPEEPPQEDQYGHFHGSASGFAFLQLARARVSKMSPISLDFPDFPLSDLNGVTTIMPPKPIADSLIHNYFDFGLTTSRFVHKPSLIAAYENLYNEKPSDILGQDQLALVYMVMAVGSHYAEKDTNFSGFSASVQYYVMAQRELERERSQITLSSLQARLLCVHYLLNHSRMHNAWSFFGTVVRNAQALRLHRESPGSGRNQIESETRKRLFWSIYIYDRILSSIFGRPSAIHDDDVDQEECELRDDDFETIPHSQPGSTTPFCSGAALIHYARLANILGRVLREFYGPARKKHNLQSLREKAIEIRGQLDMWLSNLPSYLNFIILPFSAMSTLIQRQSCTLKLTFAHTSLLLHRPFLLYSIRPDGNTEKSPNIVQWFRNCSEKSIEAASLIVNECRSLLSRGLFSRRFWLVNYAQFAAIGTLYMYSILRPGEPSLREAADEALYQFPVGVEGDPVGQRYLHILQELQKMTLGCQNANTSSHGISGFPETQTPCFDGSYLLTDEFLNNADPFCATIF